MYFRMDVTITVLKRCWLLLYLYMDVIYTSMQVDYTQLCCQRNTRVFDYIIVGAGASGATIASRLSENPYITVCLLEAGIKDTDNPFQSIIETPRLWRQLLPGPVTWNYTTIPQTGLNGRRIFTGMGKTLGGSTSHNALNYLRGLKADFDFWEASGAVGWGYNDVLPYFMKLENSVPPPSTDFPTYNVGGPFTVSQSKVGDNAPLFNLLTRTAREVGIPMIDCNNASPIGLCKSRESIKSGRRESTSTAYLQPVSGRRNLCIVTEALVRKILITNHNKRAYGVRYSKNGYVKSLKVRNEIIISAGAIGSPQLLQLSGIGPKELLRRHKVNLIVDLPVGQNFHDHVLFNSADILVNVPTVTRDVLNDPKVLSEYVSRRTGPISENSQLLAWYLITSQRRRIVSPDVLIYFDDGVRSRSNDNHNSNGTSVNIFLLQPKGRGTVQIRSRNPEVSPIIDQNYLREESDIRTMIKAIRRLQSLVKSPSMRAANAYFGTYDIPDNCLSEKPDSDQQWRCILKSLAGSGFHPVSTCKMGSKYDKTSVLDPQLRVKGINGLRVADASIMPRVVSANTMGTSIMIGEKAADLIRRHHVNTRCKHKCFQNSNAKYNFCG